MAEQRTEGVTREEITRAQAQGELEALRDEILAAYTYDTGRPAWYQSYWRMLVLAVHTVTAVNTFDFDARYRIAREFVGDIRRQQEQQKGKKND